MLSNLADMDEGMQAAALSEERAAAVLFDFAAAFPSVSRELMREMFASLGCPQLLLQFICALHYDATCLIPAGGARFAGFRMVPGIRQGRPLSPRLCAVAVDVLLRRIAHALPRALARACADDFAVAPPRRRARGGDVGADVRRVCARIRLEATSREVAAGSAASR